MSKKQKQVRNYPDDFVMVSDAMSISEEIIKKMVNVVLSGYGFSRCGNTVVIIDEGDVLVCEIKHYLKEDKLLEE